MPYAPINGQEIFFEDSGGDGYPIVMMHGFLMDQSLFDPQVAVLAPRYRCIRFDARAFGKTRWDGEAFDLYDTVSDCISLMDFLGIDKAVICGMSQGGYAAMRLAIKNPERVKALVLMSTYPGVDDDASKAQFRQMRDTWVAHGPIDPIINVMATILLGPKDAPGMAAHWNTWLPKWKSYSGNAIFHAMNNLIDRDDVTEQISRLTHPAFVSHGNADLGMPMVLGELLSKRLPNCRDFVVVPGASHAANFTHPETINARLSDFLRHLDVYANYSSINNAVIT